MELSIHFLHPAQRRRGIENITTIKIKQRMFFARTHVNIFLLKPFRTKNMCNNEKNGLRDSRNGKKENTGTHVDSKLECALIRHTVLLSISYEPYRYLL